MSFAPHRAKHDLPPIIESSHRQNVDPIWFLVSNGWSYITGQIPMIDGGETVF